MTMENNLNFVARYYETGAFDPERAWSVFLRRVGRTASPSRAWRWAIAAAVAACALILPFVLGRQEKPEFIVADTSRTIIRPDNSQIELSPGAELSFNRNGFTRRRKVELTGKAFCHITDNPERPFDISFGYGVVRVLGTSFFINVTDSIASIDVFSGKVLIARALNAPDARIIAEGQHADLTRAPKVFIFRDAPLDYVLSEIGNWFGVELNAPRSDKRLTGEFEGSSLDEILTLIETALDLKIR